ncbi:MAG: hypothetical protein JSU06_17440 [Actinobacteria bacterium]|nr:hypothetical protein [Actinomycetota bacterium]
MADRYEVDDEGNAVAETAAPADDPLRRQVEATLRFVALSTAVGLVVIAILALAIPSIRGVMILVGLVYLITSVTAYIFLRRNFNARLQHAGRSPEDA